LYNVFSEQEYLRGLEGKLEEYSRTRRIGLLLPSLYTEVKAGRILEGIIEEIAPVNYIQTVVVALGGTSSHSEFRHACRFFQALRSAKREVKVVWVLGPRIQSVLRSIQARQIPTGVHGKGQSVWIALGYLFARGECSVVALHDCDIVTYDRTLLGRLIEPTANPNNDFEFCKGYYARVSPSERAMKGRVTRLFVAPFLDAMAQIMVSLDQRELLDFFRFHQSFKYLLAGEFSFTTHLARGINIAHDWGLEVSTLSEVYKRVKPSKVAQIDLSENYEHKHQALSPEDAGKGLHRMVRDIAKFFFNYMRSHGVPIDGSFVDMVTETYFQNALNFVKSYSDDAEVNNLSFDRYEEELTALKFKDFLGEAGREARAGHTEPLIPSWNRVLYSVPDIYQDLVDAVDADQEE
jgi:glucosyl-3-phosphoglycerate synthase